jgi:hypothetical protein
VAGDVRQIRDELKARESRTVSDLGIRGPHVMETFEKEVRRITQTAGTPRGLAPLDDNDVH